MFRCDLSDREFEKTNTIIIDKSLLGKELEERYRFTMGHECGHGIFHRPGVRDPYAEYLRVFYEGTDQPAMFRCDFSDREFEKKENTQWTDKQWKEWQADVFSSSILMPKSMVIKAVEDILPYTQMHTRRVELIIEVSKVFLVSQQAAEIRLQGLGLIEPRFPKKSTPVQVDVPVRDTEKHRLTDLYFSHEDDIKTEKELEEERIFNLRDMELWGYEVPSTRGRRRKK